VRTEEASSLRMNLLVLIFRVLYRELDIYLVADRLDLSLYDVIRDLAEIPERPTRFLGFLIPLWLFLLIALLRALLGF
jgi:hypothetical protein